MASQGSQRTTLISKGWQWGGVRPNNGIFTPVQYGFIFPLLPPSTWWEKISHPILVPWDPTSPHKILFHFNLPHNYYNFFNKICFIKTRAKWSGEGRVKAGLGKIAILWLLCAAAPDYWIIYRKEIFFYKFIKNQTLEQEKSLLVLIFGFKFFFFFWLFNVLLF